MPDFRVAYQTFSTLVTNLLLLTGLSQVPEDEGGNGSKRRLRLTPAPRRVVYIAPEDEDEPVAVLRAMGML